MTIINTVGGKPAKPIYVEAVEDTPSTLPHTYMPGEGFDYLSSVTVGADPNLQAGNIKQGVSIFGVEGTYEGSGGGSSDITNIFNGDVGVVFCGDTSVNESGSHSSSTPGCYSIDYIVSYPVIFGNMMYSNPMHGSFTTSNSIRQYPAITEGTTITLQSFTFTSYGKLSYLRNLGLALGGSMPCDVKVSFFPFAAGGTTYVRTMGIWYDELDVCEGTLHLTEDTCTFTYDTDVPIRHISGSNSTDYVAYPAGAILKAELIS